MRHLPIQGQQLPGRGRNDTPFELKAPPLVQHLLAAFIADLE